jgi:hypothetical protein
MRYLGGHLGVTVSALLDGQLDAASSERAWSHVHACALCGRQVEREGWVKTQLASMDGEEPPPPQLLGSLYGLGSTAPGLPADRADRADEARAWQAVQEIEQRGRGRRRAGLVVAGAGSVSVAVLGLAGLTGSTLGIGSSTPSGPPSAAISGPRAGSATTSPNAVIAPMARVHGRLPLAGDQAQGAPSRRGPEGGGDDGLQR